MSRWQDEPFETGDVSWHTYLSSQEWALLFALWMKRELRGERVPTDFDSGMRDEALFLIHHCGYQFEGLSADEDDRLYRRTVSPVCEKNALHLAKLRGGLSPRLGAAFQVACEYAEEREDLRRLARDLRECEADVERRRQALIDARPPEVEKQYREIMDHVIGQEDVN